MRDFSDIVITKRDELTSLVFDADSFENAKSYRSSYNIPDHERLLVYANSERCRGSLEGSGTFITDEAIYVHPAQRARGDEGRIPLSDICSFLVFENKDSEVKLFGPKAEYRIFAGLGRGRSSTAGELVHILHEIQDSLMHTGENRKVYEKTIKRIYTVIRARMRETGVLERDFIDLLSVMEEVNFFKREAIFLQLENVYRTCDTLAYERLLDAKAKDLNPETVTVLRNPHDLFYVSFISDLTGPGTYSNVKAIIDAYLRLRALPTLSLYEAQLLAHFCVRMEDYSYLDEILSEMGDDMAPDELWRLLAFQSKIKNRKMHMLQAKIAGMGDVTEEELLTGNDLGLCSIHYALMLRNKELIRFLLPRCDWTKMKRPFPKDRIADALYEPMFVASYIFKDEDLLREVFIYTSPQATALKRSIRRVDSMIDINNALIKKYPEHRAEYDEKIAEYESMRSDMMAELSKLANTEVERQRQLARIIRDARHPLGDYLLNLYSSTQNLLEWLSATARDYRLSRYKNVFFVTGFGRDIGLSYYEYFEGEINETFVSDSDKGYTGREPKEGIWERRNSRIYDNPSFREAREEARRIEEEKERRRREFHEHIKHPAPHAGSWFSPAAHENVRALKEEYRILVKKYHPDSSGDERTAKVLMRIMNERADILERMKQ